MSMFEPPRFHDGDNTLPKSSSSVVIVNLPPANVCSTSLIASLASSFGPVAHVNRPEGYSFCFVHFKHETLDTQGHADTFVPRALRARFIDVQVPVSGNGANELGADDVHAEDGAHAETKNTDTEVCEHTTTTTTTTTVRCPIKPANHSDANIVRWRRNMAKKAISNNTL